MKVSVHISILAILAMAMTAMATPAPRSVGGGWHDGCGASVDE